MPGPVFAPVEAMPDAQSLCLAEPSPATAVPDLCTLQGAMPDREDEEQQTVALHGVSVPDLTTMQAENQGLLQSETDCLMECSPYYEAVIRGNKSGSVVHVQLCLERVVERTCFYELRVRKGQREWLVERSYKDFLCFERIPRKKAPSLPSLPRRSDLLVRVSQRCHANRISALEAFLAAAVAADPLLQACELRAFLRKEVATTRTTTFRNTSSQVEVLAPRMSSETLQACLLEALKPDSSGLYRAVSTASTSASYLSKGSMVSESSSVTVLGDREFSLLTVDEASLLK